MAPARPFGRNSAGSRSDVSGDWLSAAPGTLSFGSALPPTQIHQHFILSAQQFMQFILSRHKESVIIDYMRHIDGWKV
jgi:hypothetical protein